MGVSRTLWGIFSQLKANAVARHGSSSPASVGIPAQLLNEAARLRETRRVRAPTGADAFSQIFKYNFFGYDVGGSATVYTPLIASKTAEPSGPELRVRLFDSLPQKLVEFYSSEVNALHLRWWHIR